MTLLKNQKGLIQELINDARAQWETKKKQDPTIGTLRYLTMDDNLQWTAWSIKPVENMEGETGIWIDPDDPNSNKSLPVFDPEEKYDEIPDVYEIGWLDTLIDLEEGE